MGASTGSGAVQARNEAGSRSVIGQAQKVKYKMKENSNIIDADEEFTALTVGLVRALRSVLKRCESRLNREGLSDQQGVMIQPAQMPLSTPHQ